MVITIDGPAGAGKSTVARQLAQRLGFQFLDTGAMYRAVTLYALERGVDLTDTAAVADLANAIRLRLDGARIWVDDRDVSTAIRTNDVSIHVRPVADNDAVRQRLVEQQRVLALGNNIVTEGRDQGTLAFPNADCKVFLTASAEERARRRAQELQQRGERVTTDQVLAQQNARDANDAARPFGGLNPAPDAVVVDTSGLTLEQVVDQLEQLVRSRSQ